MFRPSARTFLPTLAQLARAGAASQSCDGIDIGGLFKEENAPSRDTLYWHYPHYSDQGGTPTGAIREGDWKLIEFFEDSHVELYNLALDPGEQYDFSSSFAPKAEELRRKLRDWRAQSARPCPLRTRTMIRRSPSNSKAPAAAVRSDRTTAWKTDGFQRRVEWHCKSRGISVSQHFCA